MNEDMPTYISSTMIETVGAELYKKDNGSSSSSSFQQCTLSVSSGPDDVAVNTESDSKSPMNGTSSTTGGSMSTTIRTVLYIVQWLHSNYTPGQ
jgi:hypothetical protein